MILSDQQYEFSKDLEKFLSWLTERNIKHTLGEVWRRPEMQKILYDRGWTKTLTSDHQNKMAADVFIWIGGKFLHNNAESVEIMRPIAERWLSYNPLNYWGGDWDINGAPDVNHFGRKRT